MMIKAFSILLAFASVKIVTSENLNLPQVIVPNRKLFLPQNPPRLPRIYLTGQKFALPQFCSNASEWDDIDLSLKFLADYTEPEPERSAFASLINLIKFILIKEELSCLNAISGPILQVNRPEGKIFKAVATSENSQILNKIESALANKPRHKAPPIEFYDSVDITNMIPIWRPRGNNRRRNQVSKESESKNSTCNVGPKVLQNLGPSLTSIGSNLNPAKGTGKSSCPCSKCQKLTLNVGPGLTSIGSNLNPAKGTGKSSCPCSKRQKLTLNVPCQNCNLQCQSLPSTNINPLVIGCGGNCNICQKLSNPVLSGCPKLASAAVLPGGPQTNLVLGGCPYSNTVLGCPSCSGDILTGSPCQTKQSLTVLQSGAVPLLNCFGNVMKQVTTTVLVPYTVSQLVA